MTTLSDLSDDLLRRVLFFAPAFEGASTAVLARRWRALWRSSGAINLHGLCGDPAAGDTYSRMECLGFLRRAESALAAVHAQGTVVRRLTLHVGADHNQHTLSVLSLRVGDGDGYVIGSVLSNPVARLVVELRVIVHISSYTGPGSGISKFGGIYELSYGALPSEALRVLHVTNCRNLGLSPGTAFPWLASLRLEGCTVLLGYLQSMINTAPQLTTLLLEWSFLAAEVGVTGTTHGGWALAATCVDVECYQLGCPAVTDLVLANCKWAGSSVQGGMELDVPNLRYFRYVGYVGFIGRVFLKSRMKDLARAYLHFLDEFHSEEKIGNKMSKLFWVFLQNFSDTKVLKVKLEFPIEGITIAEEDDLDGLLGRQLSRNLERLEVEARHMPSGRATAVAMANLLHCFALWFVISISD